MSHIDSISPAKPSVTLADVIAAITVRQPVLNQSQLTAEQLQITLTGIGSLDEASTAQISFLNDKAYASALPSTQAAVVLVAQDSASAVPDHSVAVVVASPYAAYASATHLFEPQALDANAATFIHPTAQVSSSALLGEGVSIGPFCVVGDQVKIGSGTRLHAQVHIEPHAIIGDNCELYPQVFIGHDTQMGDQVRIHAGASVGSEGFGFAPLGNTAVQGWERIVQLGRVVIGNKVRIGSNTCIDRGAIGDTLIEDNVIIDNLVQIGHNVKVGAGTAIAGNAGIAGSVIIGKSCMIGGGVGIAGHLQIADGVVLTGMTLVTKSIKKPGVYSSGVAAMPAMDWRRAMVKLRALGKKDN